VLAGGESGESAVSRGSGRQILAALRPLGYNARLVDIDGLDGLPQRLDGVHIVFNCLHGGSGENGVVQLLLDVLGISYPGSGPQACALAMDKVRSRGLFASRGLTIPRGEEIGAEPIESFCGRMTETLGLPLVVKPTDQGSSLGVRIVERTEDVLEAAGRVLETFGSLLAEEYVAGREITAGILRLDGEDRPLPLLEMRPKTHFYDYEAKYTEGMTEFLVPAPLDSETTARVLHAALTAHEALGCYGFSRVDLRVTDDGAPYVLEVNTLPGMTETSDLPQAAAAIGMDFNTLVEAMLATIAAPEWRNPPH